MNFFHTFQMAMLLAAANYLSCTIEVLQLSCISYQYHTFRICKLQIKTLKVSILTFDSPQRFVQWRISFYGILLYILLQFFLELKSLLMHLHFTTYTKREMELVFFHTHAL